MTLMYHNDEFKHLCPERNPLEETARIGRFMMNAPPGDPTSTLIMSECWSVMAWRQGFNLWTYLGLSDWFDEIEPEAEIPIYTWIMQQERGDRKASISIMEAKRHDA